ncbi:bifunctional 4-hydroxy-2-oxoglutarate aldolase/2-dehydro-3-deoxy-phosphogluconate aldolase [Streptomyces sp. PU-14G]|uniref:bifunctional 4-hydroxy-2-oxoglutarate aldolase/2-dehydro-3-deoxy-phosphogluconate aldolase n=1 Tax=Streptomyces sp. PU-14G TaxID=2800808 RepID=UPI0034DFF872
MSAAHEPAAPGAQEGPVADLGSTAHLSPALRSDIARLEAARIVPTVRAHDAETADQLARTLWDAGVRAFEFTATTPGWRGLVARWARREPALLLGLGTVTSASVAESALEAGAHFLVSPFQVPEVRQVTDAADRLFVEGGLSPTELRAAALRGVAKLFPAHVGGIAYLRSLRSVLPGARIMATGGVGVETAADWLAAGAFAVSIGRELTETDDVPAALARLREQPAARTNA